MAIRQRALTLTDAALSAGCVLHPVAGVLPQRLGHDDAVFVAPLLSSLVPERAANATPTFTRNSVATVMGYAADAVAGASQVLLTVAANEARFQGARRVSEGVWSEVLADGTPIPAAELLGYLAEGARTNLLLRSQEFDDASWTKYGATVTADAVVAPDGAATAEKLIESAANDFHYVLQNPTYTSASYTASIYAKAAERSWVYFYTSANGGVGRRAFFNLGTGTTGTVDSAFTASIEPLPNGWYRCRITFTSTVAAPSEFLVGVSSGDSTTTYTGDGTSGLYLWHAQLEQADFASTPIFTTAAAVTRAGDALSFMGEGSVRWEDGTNAVEFTPSYSGNAAATEWLIDLRAGGDQYALLIDAATQRVRQAAAAFSATSPDFTRESGQTLDLAGVWDVSGSRTTAYADGIPGVTTNGAGGNVSPHPTHIHIGTDDGGDSKPFGTIRNVRLFDRALTDSEVAAIPTDSLDQTARARWSFAFSSAATLKGITLPGSLGRSLSTTTDERRVRLYYSFDGGETRTELVPGDLDNAVSIAAGATLTVDADFANEADGARAQGWVEAGGWVVTEDNGTDGAITGTVSQPATIVGTVG